MPNSTDNDTRITLLHKYITDWTSQEVRVRRYDSKEAAEIREWIAEAHDEIQALSLMTH